jgi:hypothetical protein
MAKGAKKNFRYLALVLLPLAIIALSRLHLSFVKRIPIFDTSAWVDTQGPLATFHNSLYKIHYRARNGKEEVIILRGDMEDNPVMFLCPTNGSTFYCLYDCDVWIRLIKLDIGQRAQPFSAKSALNEIVASSPVLIQQGDSEDWQKVIDYLSNHEVNRLKAVWMPTIDLGIFATYAARTNLLWRMQSQFNTVYKSGGIVSDSRGD